MIDKYNQSAYLVLKVAYLYYIEEHSQSTIAEELQVSITTISRLLQKAKDEKIVEFVIRDPYIECIRLEEKLKRYFNLKDVIIAPTPELSEKYEKTEMEENVKKLVALEGARYLQRIIHENDILGITWGSTIYHMTNYLNPSQKVNAKFVTLHGDIACCENELDVRTLVSRISRAFAGEKYYLLSEALTSSAKVADIVKNERNNRKVFEMFNNINISIAGVGSFYPESTSVLSSPEFMPPEDLQELNKNNVVGDIALHFFDKSGNECKTDLSKRVISIGFEQYRKLDKKIVIASGKAKAYTLYCALKGGLADVLIIDYQLADILCGLWNTSV